MSPPDKVEPLAVRNSVYGNNESSIFAFFLNEGTGLKIRSMAKRMTIIGFSPTITLAEKRILELAYQPSTDWRVGQTPTARRMVKVKWKGEKGTGIRKGERGKGKGEKGKGKREQG